MINALIILSLFLVLIVLGQKTLIKLWWRFQFGHYTRRARVAKARWLATKESTRNREDRHCPWKIAEGQYCNSLIKMRTYEKLLSPMKSTPEIIRDKRPQ